MTTPRVAPYGSWESPVTVELAVSGATSLREVRVDGDDVYWIESRPAEGGRQVVVRHSRGGVGDVTPPGHNARTMVHEYGGGVYAVAGGTVYASNVPDGRIYRYRQGAAPEPVTPAGPFRYADLVVDRSRGRLICVREDHGAHDGDASTVPATASSGPGAPAAAYTQEPRNTIVAIALDSGDVRELAAGHDFYSSPALSPDGARLAWISWDHPNMPWDGSQLWVAEVSGDGSVGSPALVAGTADESVVQPQWSPGGVLHFVSERSGWWNLYRWREAEEAVEPLVPAEVEFAGPQWVFGLSDYAFLGDAHLLCAARAGGREWLYRLDVSAGTLEDVDTGHTEYAYVRGDGRRAALVASSPVERPSILSFDAGSAVPQVVRHASELGVDPAFISRPDPIAFATSDGDTAHALVYRPTNPLFTAPPDARPPLVVLSHGGPTGNASTALDLEIQVFTSRGFAVVDVDYRGSTGYGRAYRQKLDGRWGIVDVDDCVNAARALVEAGDADATRLAISGGSAGGYTTLSAVTFRDVFSAGASHYGVGDLEALTRETHKFESRYLDRLVAPYPDARDVYLERSPIHHAARISCPLILLQGLEDKVVPPAQAELMVAALAEQRLPHAYVAFAGEGHGFRRAENMARAVEAELSFYAQVFGFRLADPIEPVAIVNLAAGGPRGHA